MQNGRKQFYSLGDRVFLAADWLILSVLLLVIVYPLLFVVSASFSGGTAVMSLSLIPPRITLVGYQTVLEYRNIWSGYLNSIIYMATGTLVALIVTVCCAYPLSRPDFAGGGVLMTLCVITMYLNGGMIPTYLTVRSLGLLNSIWAIILPGALSVYNMIIMRTFFRTQIPSELLEASQIDGCGNIRFLLAIVLPLSGAILAVTGLFYAVSLWNSYFTPMIYLTDRAKFPLSVILREVLVMSNASINQTSSIDVAEMIALSERENVMRYALIVVASLPVMVVYPFVQKYFVKGVMIGALKG